MTPRLRTILLSAGHRLQVLFSLEDPVYATDGNVLHGAGIYSAGGVGAHTAARLGAGDGDGERYASDRTAGARQKEHV